MTIVQIGLDHRSAALTDLELLRTGIGDAGFPAAPRAAHAGVVPLVTCHRVELYLERGVASASAGDIFAAWTRTAPSRLTRVPMVREGEDAGLHLLRVAAGLESAVLGEDQVLGQLRRAYGEACAAHLASPVLHRMFHAAFRTGRRVRSETSLGHGHRSLAACGVSLLLDRLDLTRPCRVLILGAGEMASLAAHRLAERGVAELFITNRTREGAERLGSALGARVVPWEWRARALAEVDGAVAATSAGHTVMPPEALAAAAGGRAGRLVLLDLGVPRNFPVSEAVELIDVASLSSHLAADAASRQAAVSDAEAIVAEELSQWWRWTLDRANLCREKRSAKAASS